MNWAAMVAAARRAQAAYIDDAAQQRAAFQALGYRVLGRYQNADHLAVLSGDRLGFYLSISGTRFGEHGGAADLVDDIRDDAIDLGDGVHVTSGAYSGLAEMWDWVERIVPGENLTIDGHSLGAWRARYSGLFRAPERIDAIYSFESPKGGNPAFWDSQADLLPKLTSVVNGRDVFVAWPFLGQWCHPDYDTVWLTGKGAEVIRPHAWPGPLLLTDHSIDVVVQRLAALATP